MRPFRLKRQRNADGAKIVGLRLLVEFTGAKNIGEGKLHGAEYQGEPDLGIEDDGLLSTEWLDVKVLPSRKIFRATARTSPAAKT